MAHAVRGTFDRADYRRWVTETERKSRHLTALKPGRVFGASWMSDFVERRKNVNLCNDCARRYGNWYTRRNYVPLGRIRKLTDCDGCSDNGILECNAYVPREALGFWSHY